MTCESGNRCLRCLKLQYKLRVKQYEELKRSMFEDSDRDKLGNLIVHPSCIESLMRARVKIGRAYRRWKQASDRRRLDWLQRHSFAFAHNSKSGKGFIRLSAAFVHQSDDSYSLRRAIDEAMGKPIEPYHNRFGLMGGGGQEGATNDRSEVKPFSVVLYSEEEGWQQLGVYDIAHEAHKAAVEASADYSRQAMVVDTNIFLDLALDPSVVLRDIPPAARR